MLLVELFDNPLPYTYTGTEEEAAYQFVTSKGQRYEITFNNMLHGGVTIEFTDADSNYSKTDKGNAVEVMSTVYNIIMEYVKLEEPEKMHFAAIKEEKGRVLLYRRIAKRLTDYNFTEKEDDTHIHWILIRERNENMNEKWSKKYKDSINCSNPKGFSQKAHCASKKKG